ncbi:CASP-like protein 5A2 isoform X1 [Physcomitrium patens]|uniref:CASP-like protein n=1 Tax=Physcomitrium patens TaxID=3218 RepID=A9S184_PHYPA|nr:CASP-like protein 5A2 [Physcomitrium patens]PNR53593.1 hypothetical protein PHYPA_007268 [Physcomitrium patens]|eukprot:XP_024376145.1 CASP-like protein 5A2 [Physcomitrella patens]
MHQVASHTAVHPVAVPPQFPRFLHPVVRMKVLAGSPGTMGGLALRLAQTGFSLISLCIKISITGFSSISAFWFLVAAMVFQFIWSFSIGVLDTALLTKRSLWNPRIVSLVVVGDWVISMMTFAGACAAAGIVVLIHNDLDQCRSNHCGRFAVAAAMAFMSWIATTLSFVLAFWLFATRR